MNINMPVGVDDFKKLRENYYFVDKTSFIMQLLQKHSQVTLLTRPRRFGKTLTMSMLEYFFSIEKEKESRHLFDKLQIASAGEDYMSRRGTCPVIFLSFKDLKNLTWEAMLENFRFIISAWCIAHDYLGKSEYVQPELRRQFQTLLEGKSSQTELAYSLVLFMNMMQQHYGKPVILLLDEYDAPIQSAWEHGYYDACMDLMRQMLSSALKGNPFLDFAILTGVLRVAKESIFSGLNNLKVCSVLSQQYGDSMGFTSAEVRTMARDLGRENELPAVRQWYDGYRFGLAEIYNPWSVVNYFDQGQLDDYWIHSSSNTIISRLLQNLDKARENALLDLLQGKSVSAMIDEGVIYDHMEENQDALFTMLLTTGYLTAVHTERNFGQTFCDLAIPNREVRDVYRSEIIKKIGKDFPPSQLSLLLRALVTGKTETFSQLLEQFIAQFVSVYDAASKESFYHGLLLGLTALLLNDYQIESNRESGYGRFDLALFPRNSRSAGVILEFKAAASEKELPSKAREALEQIENRQYGAEFQKRGIASLWKYGIAFCGKKIQVMQEE